MNQECVSRVAHSVCTIETIQSRNSPLTRLRSGEVVLRLDQGSAGRVPSAFSLVSFFVNLTESAVVHLFKYSTILVGLPGKQTPDSIDQGASLPPSEGAPVSG